MRNVEYKCELRDISLARTIARTIGAVSSGMFQQTDTYYRVVAGRLKRRESTGLPTEVIFYDRSNDVRIRDSQYVIYSEAAAAARFGSTPLPIATIVRKARELYLLSNVRIHLDTVDRLGTFFELEAVVSEEVPRDLCLGKVEELKSIFAPALGEPIAVSYSDLMRQLEHPNEDR